MNKHSESQTYYIEIFPEVVYYLYIIHWHGCFTINLVRQLQKPSRATLLLDDQRIHQQCAFVNKDVQNIYTY